MITRSELCAQLRARDNYVILTHRRPDGDTTGCAAALCMGLRQIGKRAAVLPNRQFTPRFAPYLAGLTCPDVTDDATLVSVDIASMGLLSFDAEPYGARIALAVDHHGSNSLPLEEKLVEADKAACGEIIYEILVELGVTISKPIAEALYVAIATDTGCFKFSNTSANTFRVAAALIDAGADVFPINKLFFDTKSFARLKLEARLVDTTEFFAGGRVAICQIPNAWLTELALTEDDVDSISGFARSIEGVQIGVMIREVENGLGKLSVRTDPEYNASDLCKALGGGGHIAAAGATVAGGITGARRAILAVLSERGIVLER